MSKLEELIQERCPDGVEYKTLGELGSFFNGLTGKTKEDFTDGNAKFITYKNVYSNPALKIDVEDRVKITNHEKQNTLQYGDVIFTGSSETPDECGISSVVNVKTDEKLYLNSFCFFFRFDDANIMLPEFSKHLFRSSELRYKIRKTANGVTRYNVSKKLMEKVSIPLPPLELQREIALILDNLTELTAELTTELTEELTARKRQYKYYRDKLLTFDVHETSETCFKQLGDVVNFINGRAYKQVELLSFGKYKVLRVGNFYSNEKWYYSNLELDEEKYCNAGDLLYTWAATIGPQIWNGEKVIFHYHIWKLKFDDSILDKKFLYYFLQKDVNDIFNSVTNSTMPHVSMNSMNKRMVPIPSLNKQKKIATILDHFTPLYNDFASSLSAEIDTCQKRYEYYRDKLLTFKEK